MTCKEVRSYLESMAGADWNPSSGSAFAEHARVCPECRGCLEEQQLLAKHLALVRASAPEVPASLDAAVISNYRHHMAESAASPYRARWRFSVATALPWAAALAVVAIVAYGAIVLFVPGSSSPGGANRLEAPLLTQNARTAAEVRTPLAVGTTHRSRRTSVSKVENSEIAAHHLDSFPRDFQSLVYCDQISCPGAMDVIRVQLPAPVLGLTQAAARSDRMVSADILVGADGIARGIRVVE
jgi:hypothetical protein